MFEHLRQPVARLAAGLALAAPLAAAAGPAAPGVPLAPERWDFVRALVAFPDRTLAIRSVLARPLQPGRAEPIELEVASDYLERTDAYSRYFRVFCANPSGRWQCDAAEQIVAPADGGAVVLRPQASAQDVLQLARLLGHASGRAEARELLSVGRSGSYYQVAYRLRACEYVLRIRSEGGVFMSSPTEAPVVACP